MTYRIEKIIREQYGQCTVYDYILYNKFDVEVSRFHDEKLAIKVRDLLNNEKS